jgi:hypothetical protein
MKNNEKNPDKDKSGKDQSKNNGIFPEQKESAKKSGVNKEPSKPKK